MESVIIFGAGLMGLVAKNILSTRFEILNFCDNDVRKWGTTLEGVKVVPPNQIQRFGDIQIIIASMFSFEILSQLQTMGVTRIGFFTFPFSLSCRTQWFYEQADTYSRRLCRPNNNRLLWVGDLDQFQHLRPHLAKVYHIVDAYSPMPFDALVERLAAEDIEHSVLVANATGETWPSDIGYNVVVPDRCLRQPYRQEISAGALAGVSPFLTIAVPTWNRARYLEAALTSIFAQVGDNPCFEVIVSDNGSEDHTPEICRRFSEKYPNFMAYRNETNLGVDMNFKLAVQRSRGRYVMIHSDDDLTHDGTFPELLEVLQRHDGIPLFFIDWYCNTGEVECLQGMDAYLRRTCIGAPGLVTNNIYLRDVLMGIDLDHGFGTCMVHIDWQYEVLKLDPRFIIFKRAIFSRMNINCSHQELMVPWGPKFLCTIFIDHYIGMVAKYLGEGVAAQTLRVAKKAVLETSLLVIMRMALNCHPRMADELSEALLDEFPRHFQDEPYYAELRSYLLGLLLIARFAPFGAVDRWNLEILDVEPGKAVLKIRASEHTTNSSGEFINGGVLAVLGDLCNALALFTALDGTMPFVTSNSNIRFLEPAWGDVEATAEVQRRSNRSAIMACKLRCGSETVALCTNHFTMKRKRVNGDK
jgi:glycosyltransferase involved in cell wall biosynthesis/acyl-coenzyme A thioesterase PaaI-like protein